MWNYTIIYYDHRDHRDHRNLLAEANASWRALMLRINDKFKRAPRKIFPKKVYNIPPHIYKPSYSAIRAYPRVQRRRNINF